MQNMKAERVPADPWSAELGGRVSEKDEAVFRSNGGSQLAAEGIGSAAELKLAFGAFGEALQNQLLESAGLTLQQRVAMLTMLKGEEQMSHKVKEGLEEVKKTEELLELWKEYSGMHRILERLEKDKDRAISVNDLSLALINGVSDAVDKAVEGIQDSAVISALILSFSVPLLVDPPDALVELDSDDWLLVMHYTGWGLVTAAGAGVILYAKIYTTAVARAARSSDKLRIFLAGDAYTHVLILTYSLFFFFCVAFLADVVEQYGRGEGAFLFLLTSATLLLCGALGWAYIRAGHIEYGWRAHGPSNGDPVDDHLAFDLLKKKAEASRHFAHEAWSVFDFRRSTKAAGITSEGRALLFDE